jgi:hypothetical protein
MTQLRLIACPSSLQGRNFAIELNQVAQFPPRCRAWHIPAGLKRHFRIITLR